MQNILKQVTLHSSRNLLSQNNKSSLNLFNTFRACKQFNYKNQYYFVFKRTQTSQDKDKINQKENSQENTQQSQQKQQQQQQRKSSYYKQPKKAQIKTEKEAKIFLDKAKFKSEDEGLVIYFSKEEKFFKGFSVSILLFFGYNVYKCINSEQIEDKQNHYYLSCIFGVLFLFMQYRIHKCPKTIWLDMDGKTSYIDFYRFGGFGSKPIALENINYRGYGSWMHKVTNTPVFYYRYNGKRKFGFFKKSEVTEAEVLKNVFMGKMFNVTQKGLDKQFSKKSKDKYSL